MQLNKDMLIEQFGIPSEAAEHLADMVAEALDMSSTCAQQTRFPKVGEPRLTLAQAIAGLGSGYTVAGAHLTQSGNAPAFDSFQEWIDGINAVIMENLQACGCFSKAVIAPFPNPVPDPIAVKMCAKCAQAFAGDGDLCDDCQSSGAG